MARHKKNKIVIIGAGFVGSTLAYTLMHSGIVSEIVLIDIDEDRVMGEVADLNHGLSFLNPVDLTVGDYHDCQDANIIVITAGPSFKPGQTRLDLAHQNSRLTRDIVKEITRYTNDAILLLVSNPVDILTYVATKVSGFHPHQVIGSGTVLDTARFRYLLSEHCKIDVRNVHGYILGEHGDSEVPIWSMTNIAGRELELFCQQCSPRCNPGMKEEIFSEVRDSSYKIIKGKGATYYGVSLAVRRIIEAIIRNEQSVLTVSSVVQDQYGIADVALSLPSIVDKTGIRKVLDLPLAEEEVRKLQHSAETLRKVLCKLDIL